MKLKYPLFLSIITIFVSGCASLGVGESDFACKGYPDGLACMSSQDIYTLSNGANYKDNIAAVAREQGGDPDRYVNRLPDEGGVYNPDQSSNTDMPGEYGGAPRAFPQTNPVDRKEISSYIKSVLPKPSKEIIPLRTPAMVMRIFVAPWESKNGDLNVPSYVYTEIEKRRWMIGNKAITLNRSIKPLNNTTREQPLTTPQN